MDMEEKPKYGKFISGLHLLVFVKVCGFMFFRDPYLCFQTETEIGFNYFTAAK